MTKKSEYFANAMKIPKKGEALEITLVGDFDIITATPIELVNKVGEKVYKVETANAIYFVKVQ